MQQVHQFTAGGDLQQAKQYLSAAMDWSKQHNDYDVQAVLYSELIRLNYQMGNLDKAEELCTKALSLAPRNEKFAKWQEPYLLSLALINKRRGKSNESASLMSRVFQLAETDNAKERVANTLDLFASIDEAQGRRDFADFEYDRAVSILKGLPDEKDLLTSLKTGQARRLRARKLK
jgi:tetratricopeptide (TPR) repeat protein